MAENKSAYAQAGVNIDVKMGAVGAIKQMVASTKTQNVIGGIGSLGGSVLGAFIIGIAEMLFAGLVPTNLTNYRDAFVFAAMIVILLFRPNGIFGKQEGGRS